MQEFSKQLTLFTEDSLADVNPSAWQESKKGRKTIGIYGRNFRAWSESLDRVGYSLKMYLEYCLSQQTTFAGIWSVKTTKSGFGIMKLRLSAHHTEGNEYFLWRTPDAHCYRGASSKERYEMKLKKGLPISLNDQVAHTDCTGSGSLNPEWIEALMGFPIGWTDLKH